MTCQNWQKPQGRATLPKLHPNIKFGANWLHVFGHNSAGMNLKFVGSFDFITLLRMTNTVTEKYLGLVRGFYKSYTTMKNFQRCAGKCRVVEAEEGRVKVELDVEEEHLNGFGTLHGGLTATLIDVVTTTAMCATRKGKPGVSVDLSVSYLSAAKKGETILVDAYVTRMGQSLGFTQADVYRKSDGRKIAIGMHTKAFPKGPLGVAHDETGKEE